MKVINKNKLQKKKKGFNKDKEGKLIINSMLEGALKEIAILKKITHPNIVKIIDLAFSDKNIELCLEYCEYDLKKPTKLYT